MGTHKDQVNQAPFLSDDDLEEIKKRCQEATPGPWKSYVEGREEMSGSDFIMTEGEDIYLTGAAVADQDFIAHARQDIPKLVAEVERLRKLLPK
jgi:hypothetical protein